MALLLFAWSFLVIAAYYIIAPVKGALLMTNFGPTIMPWVYMASAAATGLAVWVYSRFTHLPRRRLVMGTLVVLEATLVGWWFVALSASSVGWVCFVFSLWSDVFSIMAPTVLWSYANDVFTAGGAKRGFGLVAAGGPLGGVAGSLLTRRLVPVIGLPNLLLVAAVLFALTLLVFALAESRARDMPPKPPAATRGGVSDVLGTIRGSAFLTALALVVLLERLVPDFANYLFNSAALTVYPTREAFAMYQASYQLWQSAAALAVGMGATGWLLKRVGVGPVLAGAPVTNLLGFVAFASWPLLWVAAAHNGLEGLQRYTTFKAAKESTYTVAERAVIYKVKAFIEMFLYRFARFLSGAFLLLLTSPLFLGAGPAWVAWAGVPLAALWIYAAWRLGSEFRKLERGTSEAEGFGSHAPRGA